MSSNSSAKVIKDLGITTNKVELEKLRLGLIEDFECWFKIFNVEHPGKIEEIINKRFKHDLE